jgi:hypothetical protein
VLTARVVIKEKRCFEGDRDRERRSCRIDAKLSTGDL